MSKKLPSRVRIIRDIPTMSGDFKSGTIAELVCVTIVRNGSKIGLCGIEIDALEVCEGEQPERTADSPTTIRNEPPWIYGGPESKEDPKLLQKHGQGKRRENPQTAEVAARGIKPLPGQRGLLDHESPQAIAADPLDI